MVEHPAELDRGVIRHRELHRDNRWNAATHQCRGHAAEGFGPGIGGPTRVAGVEKNKLHWKVGQQAR